MKNALFLVGPKIGSLGLPEPPPLQTTPPKKNDGIIPVASGTCVVAWHLKRAVGAVEAAGLGGFPRVADQSGVPRGNPHWAHLGWSPCRGWGRWWEQNGLTCWRGRKWQTPGAVKR